MANCFPIAKYIYLFVLLVISFSLITTSKTLEMLGLGLLFAVNAIYSILMVADVVSYMEKRSRQTLMSGLATWSIIVGNVFTLVSSIFLIIMLSKLGQEFRVKGNPIRLNGENRENLNLFKSLWIASIVLLTVVSLNIYFNADRMAYSVSTLLDNLTNISAGPINLFVLALYALVALGLWGSLMQILFTKYKEDENLNKFREYFSILSGMLGGIAAVDLTKIGVWWFGQSNLEWFVSRAFGIDAAFDWVKWSCIIISVVFSGLLIERFVQIPDVKNVYSEAHFYEIFVSFITFTLLFLMSQLANSTYMVELIMLIVKVFAPFAPLAILGTTSYMIFLGNKFLRLSKNNLTE